MGGFSMKNIAKILLLTIIVSLSLTLFGCANIFEPKWRALNSSFMVTIDGIKQQEVIDFEVSKSYYFDIKLFGDVTVDDNTQNDIKIEYNEENAVVTYAYDSPRSKTLTYKIYCYELGNNDTLKISYNGKTIEIGYNVLDYDFDGHGYVLSDSLSDLDKYPEFKEMLLSIDYYEFKEPYIGVSKYDFSVIDDEKTFGVSLEKDANNSNYASTDYLKYLMDSVYYPTKYDLVLQNPIASRNMYFSVPKETDTSESAKRTVMNSFSLSFAIIDPCCTNPQYPLQDISFYAQNKELFKYYGGRYFEGDYPAPIAILLEMYPERFFQYKMGDITIYILIHKDNGASAYFEDDTYFYQMSTYYETK